MALQLMRGHSTTTEVEVPRLDIGWIVFNVLLFAGGLLGWAVYLRRDLRAGFPEGLPDEPFGMEIPSDGVAKTLLWPLAALNLIAAAVMAYQGEYGGTPLSIVIPAVLGVLFAVIALSRRATVRLLMPIVWRIM